MREIISRIEDLRTLSGNAQIAYLNSVKSPLLREVLEYTLDTNKKYKITEKKYDKATPPLFNVTLFDLDRNYVLTKELWHEFTKILDYLSEIKSATDEDVQKVKNFIEPCAERDFLKCVLYKDLRLGLDRKKCQKVWSDFCVTYPYMGCKSFSIDNLKKILYPAYAQTKMDGSFCNIIVDPINKTVDYVSRQSKPQKMQGALDVEFLKLPLKEKFVFTGEALVWDEKREKPLPRKIGNGILRRDDKTPDEIDRIFYTCWDLLPYDKFLEKRWDKPYTERLELLGSLLEHADTNKVKFIQTEVVNSLEEAMAVFEREYENGQEGIVVKNFNQIWQDGKPSGQVKIKAEKSCELRMISFQEGRGAYAGMCGNITCESEDGILSVNVKPRCPQDAQECWKYQDIYKGKILEVKFNEVIESETKDKPSLYLPVFVEIRDDKDKADTYEIIKAM